MKTQTEAFEELLALFTERRNRIVALKPTGRRLHVLSFGNGLYMRLGGEKGGNATGFEHATFSDRTAWPTFTNGAGEKAKPIPFDVAKLEALRHLDDALDALKRIGAGEKF